MAYVVIGPESNHKKDHFLKGLRSYLESKLPDYMIPGVFVVLEIMPLTPNGKVDRKALPAPGESDIQKQPYVAPRNEIEKRMCGVWQEVLGLEKVGIEDNFFAIGGDSIQAMQVVSKARRQGLQLSIRNLDQSWSI